MSATYTSSDGTVREIADMPYPHLKAAARKRLARQGADEKGEAP